jgi:HD-like signal output (HDOD) protein
MKKQICFVGFDDGELAALQPSLVALDGAWSSVFAPDEETALSAMAGTPYDAAVISLSLGGIDSTFLQKASAQAPRTLRFVIGDVSHRELIISLMGAAHQFISRPWKPGELISIIERSLALDSWLSNDKLRSFIPRLGNLPGLPATYFEIIKKTESSDSTTEAIAEIIARDPSLTARLLQLVNSPASGLNEKITSPNEAVARLGLDAVKALVLCLQLFSQSSSTKGGSISLDQLWRRSFTVAKYANKIVLQCITSERMAGEAYTAGLLHNIGQIVLATNLAKEYTTVVTAARNQKRPLQEVEMELLGVTSNQVGAYLLGLWGLPLPIVEAAALHYSPASATPVEFSLLTVIHVANVLACEDEGKAYEFPLPQLDANYLATLELPKKTDGWRKVLSKKIAIPESNTEIRAAERPPPPRASSRKAEPSGTPRRFGKIFALGAAAFAVIAFVAFKPHTLSVMHTPASTVAAETTAPQPSEAVDAQGGAPKRSPLDSVKIQSIIYSAAHPVVLLNGTALEVGGHLNGVAVVAIGRNQVILAADGERRTFSLDVK